MGGLHLPVSLHKITDWMDWMEKGHEKDATFLSNDFTEIMKELNVDKKLIDLGILDDVSICKLAQICLLVSHLYLSCITGVDHIGNIIFRYWAEIEQVSHLIEQVKVSNTLIPLLVP